MAMTFDIVDLVTRTYRTIYAERAYLVRLATVPAFLMFINFLIVTLVFPDLSALRSGLFMIPAMMAEAWIVCQFLRTLMTGERWPIRLPANFSGPPPAPLIARARGLLSGLIFYLLIALSMNAAAGVTVELIKNGQSPDAKELTLTLPPEVNLVLTVGFILVILNFRLLWLYIPFVVNLPAQKFLQATKGWLINFHLLGLWLATMTPLMFISIIFLQPLMEMTKGDDLGSFIAFVVAAFLKVILQVLLAVASSTAIAMALAPLLFGPPPPKNA